MTSKRKGELSLSIYRRALALSMKRRGKPMSATKLIAVTFFVIICVGTGLLMLPAASRDGSSCAFLKALFTATAALSATAYFLKYPHAMRCAPCHRRAPSNLMGCYS